MDGPPGPAPRWARSQKTTVTVSVVQFFFHLLNTLFASHSQLLQTLFYFFQSFTSSLLQTISKIDNVLFGGAAIQRRNRVLVYYSGISLVNFIKKTLDLR